jgi:hypothetical protein
VNADVASVRAKLIEQGKIVLSIDGVQFDETSPVLYVLRDSLSRRVLYAERVPNRDAAHLRPLLKKVKDIGVPITGVISDNEKALVVAVRDELPGVKHQYCQTHFLKNLVKPMEQDLAKIGEINNHATTAIKKLERQLPRLAQAHGSTPAELKMAQQLCQAARSGGKSSGDAILHPTALKRYERLGEVKAAAEEAVRSKPNQDLALVTHVVGALAILQIELALVRRIQLQMDIVRRIAHILNFEGSGQQIRRQLRTYLNQLARLAPKRGRGAARGHFIDHVVKLSNRYWAGLFHTYDMDGLPKNNNTIEQLFSRFKRHERKVTGRKSTAGGPLETCAEFLLEAWDTIRSLPDLEVLIAEVTDEQLKNARKKLEALSNDARVKRRIQRNPQKFLAEALKEFKGQRET